MAELVRGVGVVAKMRGGREAALAEWQVTFDFAVATVVAIRPICEGETFTEENIWVKRPGTGQIPAEQYGEILGRTAAAPISEHTHLTWEMVEGWR